MLSLQRSRFTRLLSATSLNVRGTCVAAAAGRRCAKMQAKSHEMVSYGPGCCCISVEQVCGGGHAVRTPGGTPQIHIPGCIDGREGCGPEMENNSVGWEVFVRPGPQPGVLCGPWWCGRPHHSSSAALPCHMHATVFSTAIYVLIDNVSQPLTCCPFQGVPSDC